MPELLSLMPEESELDLFRTHAREQRRQAWFAYLEAEATLAEWSAAEVDPNNFALTNERNQFVAAAKQRAANLVEKYKYWDARVKQYGTKETKPKAETK